jgi:hypothetical protein
MNPRSNHHHGVLGSNGLTIAIAMIMVTLLIVLAVLVHW